MFYQRYQWFANAYENRRQMAAFATLAEIEGTLPKLVDIRNIHNMRRWRMTCELYEFVTDAYKYSASVANFERMRNILGLEN